MSLKQATSKGSVSLDESTSDQINVRTDSNVTAKKPSDHATIKIGNESQDFDINKLKRLTYFSSLFSDRWRNETSEDDPNSNNLNNSVCKRNIDIFGPNVDSVPFTCQDLSLLLAFGESGHIPFNLSNHLQLESLVNCSDFFATPCSSSSPSSHTSSSACSSSCDTYSIGDDHVLEYLQNCVPSIDFNQRKAWRASCRNDRILRCLHRLERNLEQKLSHSRNQLLQLSACQTPRRGIVMDSDSAALLFATKFEFHFDWYGTELRVRVQGVETSADAKDLERVWKMFDFTQYWHFVCTPLRNILSNLCKCEVSRTRVNINDHARKAVVFLLKSVIKKLPNRQNTFLTSDVNIPTNLNRFSLVKAHFNICHLYADNRYFKNVREAYTQLGIGNLCARDKNELLGMLLDTREAYIDTVENEDPQLEERFRAAAVHWCELLRTLVEDCEGKYLVRNAKRWFPIVMKQMRTHLENEGSGFKAVAWVMDAVAAKLSTQLAFDFGIYLINFMVYGVDPREAKLDRKIVEFVKRHVGVTWDVVNDGE